MIEFYKFRLHILGLSFNDIGRFFDRDQSSVQYCVKKVEAALKLKNTPP